MNKIEKLKRILKKLERVVVAYSGGLDSTFLLKVAADTLGRGNVLAVTAKSKTYPVSEHAEAKRIAKNIGVRHLTIKTSELRSKKFISNPVNRCYYCKIELFKKMNNIRKKGGFKFVLDGTNYDDLKDIRYGRIAAREFAVKSPLLEARMTKADIRKLSKRLNLTTWDKPSFACLASRIPFGRQITAIDLKKIGEAEDYLMRLGFKQVRVRLHKDIARIEVFKNDFTRALKLRDMILQKLKNIGFVYVVLDLGGYRTGSMHEARY